LKKQKKLTLLNYLQDESRHFTVVELKKPRKLTLWNYLQDER